MNQPNYKNDSLQTSSSAVVDKTVMESTVKPEKNIIGKFTDNTHLKSEDIIGKKTEMGDSSTTSVPHYSSINSAVKRASPIPLNGDYNHKSNFMNSPKDTYNNNRHLVNAYTQNHHNDRKIENTHQDITGHSIPYVNAHEDRSNNDNKFVSRQQEDNSVKTSLNGYQGNGNNYLSSERLTEELDHMVEPKESLSSHPTSMQKVMRDYSMRNHSANQNNGHLPIHATNDEQKTKYMDIHVRPEKMSLISSDNNVNRMPEQGLYMKQNVHLPGKYQHDESKKFLNANNLKQNKPTEPRTHPSLLNQPHPERDSYRNKNGLTDSLVSDIFEREKQKYQMNTDEEVVCFRDNRYTIEKGRLSWYHPDCERVGITVVAAHVLYKDREDVSMRDVSQARRKFLYISNVEPRSSAELAGLKEGDVLLSLDKIDMTTYTCEDLKMFLHKLLKIKKNVDPTCTIPIKFARWIGQQRNPGTGKLPHFIEIVNETGLPSGVPGNHPSQQSHNLVRPKEQDDLKNLESANKRSHINIGPSPLSRDPQRRQKPPVALLDTFKFVVSFSTHSPRYVFSVDVTGKHFVVDSIQKILPDVGTPLLVGDLILEVDDQKVFEKFHGDPKMFEKFISQEVSGIKPFLIQRDASNDFANSKEKSPYYPPGHEIMNDYMPPSRVNPSPSNFPGMQNYPYRDLPPVDEQYDRDPYLPKYRHGSKGPPPHPMGEPSSRLKHNPYYPYPEADPRVGGPKDSYYASSERRGPYPYSNSEPPHYPLHNGRDTNFTYSPRGPSSTPRLGPYPPPNVMNSRYPPQHLHLPYHGQGGEMPRGPYSNSDENNYYPPPSKMPPYLGSNMFPPSLGISSQLRGSMYPGVNIVKDDNANENDNNSELSESEENLPLKNVTRQHTEEELLRERNRINQLLRKKRLETEEMYERNGLVMPPDQIKKRKYTKRKNVETSETTTTNETSPQKEAKVLETESLHKKRSSSSSMNALSASGSGNASGIQTDQRRGRGRPRKEKQGDSEQITSGSVGEEDDDVVIDFEDESGGSKKKSPTSNLVEGSIPEYQNNTTRAEKSNNIQLTMEKVQNNEGSLMVSNKIGKISQNSSNENLAIEDEIEVEVEVEEEPSTEKPGDNQKKEQPYMIDNVLKAKSFEDEIDNKIMPKKNDDPLPVEESNAQGRDSALSMNQLSPTPKNKSSFDLSTGSEHGTGWNEHHEFEIGDYGWAPLKDVFLPVIVINVKLNKSNEPLVVVKYLCGASGHWEFNAEDVFTWSKNFLSAIAKPLSETQLKKIARVTVDYLEASRTTVKHFIPQIGLDNIGSEEDVVNFQRLMSLAEVDVHVTALLENVKLNKDKKKTKPLRLPSKNPTNNRNE